MLGLSSVKIRKGSSYAQLGIIVISLHDNSIKVVRAINLHSSPKSGANPRLLLHVGAMPRLRSGKRGISPSPLKRDRHFELFINHYSNRDHQGNNIPGRQPSCRKFPLPVFARVRITRCAADVYAKQRKIILHCCIHACEVLPRLARIALTLFRR